MFAVTEPFGWTSQTTSRSTPVPGAGDELFKTTGFSNGSFIGPCQPVRGAPGNAVARALTWSDLTAETSKDRYATYAPNGEHPKNRNIPIRTISWLSEPGPLLIDDSDNLYVRNVGANDVLILAPGQSKPWQVVLQGISQPAGIALDDAGKLYVANCGKYCGDSDKDTVTVYTINANGAAENQLVRTISKGLLSPISFASDQ